MVAGGSLGRYVELYSPNGGCSHILAQGPLGNMDNILGFFNGKITYCAVTDASGCYYYNPASDNWTIFTTPTKTHYASQGLKL